MCQRNKSTVVRSKNPSVEMTRPLLDFCLNPHCLDSIICAAFTSIAFQSHILLMFWSKQKYSHKLIRDVGMSTTFDANEINDSLLSSQCRLAFSRINMKEKA